MTREGRVLGEKLDTVTMLFAAAQKSVMSNPTCSTAAVSTCTPTSQLSFLLGGSGHAPVLQINCSVQAVYRAWNGVLAYKAARLICFAVSPFKVYLPAGVMGPLVDDDLGCSLPPELELDPKILFADIPVLSHNCLCNSLWGMCSPGPH